MLRENKEQMIADIKERFDRMSSAVLVDFGGMNVEMVSDLRNKFREKGIEYKVVKNTLVRHALKGTSYDGKLDDVLKGMTGIAWSFEEPSAAARVVKDFRKDNENLEIKAGVLEGDVLDAKGVENTLAKLPSKDEARATLLATLQAPAQNLVRLLNAPAQNFVGVLSAKQRAAEGG